MPSLPEPLSRAFAAGATVVTPNRRLARGLVALYDRGQRDVGRAAWTAARALPWDAWLLTLWQDALAAGAVPPTLGLRSEAQSAHAWRDIVGTHATPLVDPQGAAALAAAAWTTVHAWGEGGESWRAWEGGEVADDDCAAFAQWANRYARGLAAAGAVDPAQLGDRLCAWASAMPSLRGASVVLAGFIELAPQQERLAAAVARAGANLVRLETLPQTPGRIAQAHGATPRDEIARALTWARKRARENPRASIAIAVADLAARRDEIRALADALLCPALQWPGCEADVRPYNLSLGGALAEAPLVAAALDLIAWADDALPPGRAAVLLRSPFVGGAADAWMRRASFERTWLEQGRRAIPLRSATTALRTVDRALADRWTAARERHGLPGHGSPREHVEAWRAWLAALGWPGARVPDSAEFQALGAWDKALAEFATLGAVTPRMTRADAHAALRAELAARVFQPETPPAPIQIVGLLEAAGQPFDALWVAGLAAERWPPAPHPDPLLPVAWQRSRNVPRSSAGRELGYARALTEAFARAAPEVVFSYPATLDDHPCSPSMLMPAATAPYVEIAADLSTPSTQFANRAPRESIADPFAPPLAAGTRMRGGARLVEAQSDCPFKAMAAFRLAIEPWPEPIDGLSAQERGSLVHAALAAFWRDVGTWAALRALSPETLGTKVAAAVAAGTIVLADARWRTMLPLVAAAEAARIEALVRDWLACELERPPFAVLGVEKGAALTVHGLALSLRLDRIDAIDGGGVAIVDYKTGRVKAPDAWFEPRPQAPQLGLYALAQRAASPGERVRAVAYVQLRPGEIGVRGLAADAAAWPGLALPSSLRHAGLADWPSAEARWAEAIEALGAEIASGIATVTPRDTKTTCPHCRRQSFCRIGALAIADRDEDDDE